MEINLLKNYAEKYFVKNGCTSTLTKLFYNYLYRLNIDYNLIRTREKDYKILNTNERIFFWKITDQYINNLNKYLNLVVRNIELQGLRKNVDSSICNVEVKKIIKHLIGDEYYEKFAQYRNKFAAHHLVGEPYKEDLVFAESYNSFNPINYSEELNRICACFTMHSKKNPKITFGGKHCFSITLLHEKLISDEVDLDSFFKLINWSIDSTGF